MFGQTGLVRGKQWLMLIAVGVVAANVAHADDISDIVASWTARQKRVNSFHFKGTAEISVVSPKSAKFSTKGEVALDQTDRIRVELTFVRTPICRHDSCS